jgi:hypothetical protein
MLYRLDANVLITANSTYYPIDQVPEYWSWIQYQAESGNVKIPFQILEEILAGRKEKDPLLDWIKQPEVKKALQLEETVRPKLVQRAVCEGYADDLNDEEIAKLGRDPFLIAYGLAQSGRCVVTTEVSRPGKKRHNRKVPDVCASLSVPCCGPFEMNRALRFRTAWNLEE